MKWQACSVLILLSMSGWARAQKPVGEGPVGIFQSQAEYREFMGAAKRAAYGPEGSRELQAMIPMLNDFVLNRPLGSTASQYKTQQGAFDLLSDPKVRADLEMLDFQYDELKSLGTAIQSRAAKRIQGLDFKDTANLVKQIHSIRDQAQSELDALLLPHQAERLQQILLQSRLRRRSLADLLTSDPFKTELEISEEQSEELKSAEEKIEEELAQEIEKLRQEAREKLISTLKPDQEKRVKEMLGGAFEFSRPTKTPKGKPTDRKAAPASNAKKP